MNAAELVIKAFENEGVKYIFGVPGEENEDILMALRDSSILFIPTRHEQGAAFMADVWGRLTGTAGVCLSTLGPGATNLVTGIADANLDKAPLVALTGQGSSDRLHHESHQMIDVVQMMTPITKWSSSINETSIIPEVVRKAFKLAEAEKPGATHIELPENIAAEEVSETIKILSRTTVRRPSPDYVAIDNAVELIRAAKKPILLAGNGAIRNRSSEALTTFAKKFNLPVACTFMGKGAVSDKEDCSLGAVGLGFKDYVIEAFEKADLVISIGYDIAEYNPSNWNIGVNKKLIHLDFEPSEVFDDYVPEVEIIGDLASSLRVLTDQIPNKKYDSWYKNIRERIINSIHEYSFAENADSFHAPGVINEVRNKLPDHGLLISDVGSHKMWIARNFRTFCPNGCIISNGLASMGIALPGGIGAYLADTKRPIVCIMGDGGAMMNIQELETARRLNINCTYIILNDNNYGLIEWKQEMSQGTSFGTELGNPDFVKLAESFGIDGYKPTDLNDLRNILDKTIGKEKLSLIEIPIDTEVNDQIIKELENYFK